MILYTTVPLYDEPDYSFNINLGGTSYFVRFIYNEQMKLYTINLYEYDKTPIVEGVGLVPNYPILTQLNHSNWNGFFYLATVAEQDKEYYLEYPQNLSRYYELRFYYNDNIR